MTPQLLDAGVYTPTYSNTTNLDASTPNEHMWFRVGNLVHVSGSGDVDPTAAAPTQTVLGISLPLPSAFASVNDAAGVAGAGGLVEVGIVRASVANARAECVFLAVSTASHAIRYEFTYRLINV